MDSCSSSEVKVSFSVFELRFFFYCHVLSPPSCVPQRQMSMVVTPLIIPHINSQDCTGINCLLALLEVIRQTFICVQNLEATLTSQPTGQQLEELTGPRVGCGWKCYHRTLQRLPSCSQHTHTLVPSSEDHRSKEKSVVQEVQEKNFISHYLTQDQSICPEGKGKPP